MTKSTKKTKEKTEVGFFSIDSVVFYTKQKKEVLTTYGLNIHLK